jgi:P-type Cu+ transporter
MVMSRDPVCQADVDENSATATSTYRGEKFYFDSEDCKQRFDSDPERYISRSEHSQS